MANLRVAIDKVAPPAGAWIETLEFSSRVEMVFWVAPPAGAWIETWECITERGGAVASRPPRARGLKLQQGCGPMSMCRVASRAGRVD